MPRPAIPFRFFLLGFLPAAMSVAALHAQTRDVAVDDFSAAVVRGDGVGQTVVSGANTYRALVHKDLFSESAPGYLGFSASSFAAGYLTFPAVRLAAPGDWLTLAFTVRYPQGAADKNSGLRFGLYNIKGNIDTARSNDAGNPDGDTAEGYYITLNPGGAGKVWSAGSLGLSKDLGNKTVTQYNAVLGGPQGASASVGNFARSSVFGSEPRRVTITVTRTALGVTISGSVAGESFEEKADEENAFTVFDSFFFGNGASSGAWRMSDLSVTTGSKR